MSDKSDPKNTLGLTGSFLAYKSTLERLVKRFVKKSDAEDIISETYLRSYERFGNDEVEYPKAFLFKTARNLALNYIAKHENRYLQSMEDFPGGNVYLVSEELESQIEAREKFGIFCRVVDDLPPKCRKAFILKRVHGWSIKSIAEEMDISVSTVEKHVAKGLLLCTNALKERGYDLKGIADKSGSRNIINKS